MAIPVAAVITYHAVRTGKKYMKSASAVKKNTKPFVTMKTKWAPGKWTKNTSSSMRKGFSNAWKGARYSDFY